MAQASPREAQEKAGGHPLAAEIPGANRSTQAKALFLEVIS